MRNIGSLTGTIAGAWNLDFSDRRTRHDNLRRLIHWRISCRPKGKGNRSWKRADALEPQPGVLIWPDYAIPVTIKKERR